MTVSRDVVLDLLPVYLAGEASDDTRRIVESHLEGDPALAAVARDEKTKLPPVPAPRPEAEIRTLQRTRAVVRRRSWLLGGATFFCLLPASVYGSDAGISWLAKENPALAALFGVIGIVLVSVYVAEGRKLRITGL